MNSSIAIVFGFSEPCTPLARQLILSCNNSIVASKIHADVSYFPYTCNYSINTTSGKSFSTNRFDDLGVRVIVNNCDFEWRSPLPDISIYDHFDRNYLDNYDYVLFCHNDIHFRSTCHFHTCIVALEDRRCNIVADYSLTCNNDVSARFLPGFIFVKKDKFRLSNLSFCNDYDIFSDDMKKYPARIDGGAGLFASYYSTNNKIDAIPCLPPKNWFHHLRIDSDYGIEMHNLLFPGTTEFNDVIDWANRYVDRQLFEC